MYPFSLVCYTQMDRLMGPTKGIFERYFGLSFCSIQFQCESYLDTTHLLSMYTYLPALQQNIIVDQCVSDSCFMIFYLFCTVLQTN